MSQAELSGTGIVVDDDIATVKLLVEFLEIKGIKIIGKGYCGKDAVELYQKLKPDFVFLDIMMPQFDGFYAFNKIKGINKNAVVIMITADLNKETAERLERLGIPYLYKPYEFDEIVSIVQNAAKHKGRQANAGKMR